MLGSDRSIPPQCWGCGKNAVVPSSEAGAPSNELQCVACGWHFLGTPDEVQGARRATRSAKKRPPASGPADEIA